MDKSRTAAALALVAVCPFAVMVGAASCGGNAGAEGGCASTASCGGNFVGSWKVGSTCQFSPPRPTQPLTYTEYATKPQDPLVPPVQPLPSTSGDWCSNLFYPGPGSITDVELWHETAILVSGNVTFNGDKTYQTNLVFQDTKSSTHFNVTCLQMSGFSPTCSELQTDLISFYAMAKGQKFTNIQCVDASDGGCDCKYIYEVDVSDDGTWTTSSGLLYENSQTYTYNGLSVQEYQPQVPTAATYCANGGVLTLTGNDGASLAGVLGLRTLYLDSLSSSPSSSGAGGMSSSGSSGTSSGGGSSGMSSAGSGSMSSSDDGGI
jgi:hypothetical protein